MAPGSRATSTGGSSIPNNQNQQGSSKRLLKILYWIVVLVMLACAYANIRPYEIAVRHFFGYQVSGSFIKLVSRIPIVNGLAAIFGASMFWIVGALFWALLQSVEIFPVVLQRDQAFIRTLIYASEQHQKFEVKEGEDPTLSALKRWYNLFPSVTIARARNAALFCYVIDFLVVSVVYPPAKNFGQAVFYIMSGQWSRLSWINIFYLLLTLFAVDLLTRFLFWLGEIIYFMKSAHKN